MCSILLRKSGVSVRKFDLYRTRVFRMASMNPEKNLF